MYRSIFACFVNVVRRPWRIILSLFVLVFCSAAVTSHFVAYALGFRQIKSVQQPTEPIGHFSEPVFSFGSSLKGFAIDEALLTDARGWHTISKGCGAGSPAEFEFLLNNSANNSSLIIFTSIFEMSEGMISPSRTALVPFLQSVGDTWDMVLGWEQTKTLLWKYPLDSLQEVFPTLGRSWEVQVLARDKIRALLGRSSAPDSDDGPIDPNPTSNEIQRSLLDWDAGRLERNVVQMQQMGVSLHSNFAGPKARALDRILTRSRQSGTFNIVVILPVSPTFISRNVDREAVSTFDLALIKLQDRHPDALIIRLDNEGLLQSDDLFWDLVHMNARGQASTTALLLERLNNSTLQK
jgi:hypothetical protein